MMMKKLIKMLTDFVDRADVMRVGHLSVGAPAITERSSERDKRIALTGVSSITAHVVSALLGLVSVPLTINYMGKEKFGLWMLISSLIVWIQLSDFGIINGLNNALAEANGRNDKQASNSYMSAALTATSIISISSIVPLYFLSQWLPWHLILNITQGDLSQLAGQCFLIAGANSPVNFVVVWNCSCNSVKAEHTLVDIASFSRPHH